MDPGAGCASWPCDRPGNDGETSSVHTALAASRERVPVRAIALLEASAAPTDHIGDGADNLER